MKRSCTKCNEEQDEDQFYVKKRPNSRTTIDTTCKSCHREYRKKHYLDNKQVYMDKAKVSHARVKQWYVDYKETLSCSRCSQDHPATLQFHHPSDDKEYNVATMVCSGHGIESIKREIEKCIVLCANCHSILHWGHQNIECFENL